jgi:hypothetical protein
MGMELILHPGQWTVYNFTIFYPQRTVELLQL